MSIRKVEGEMDSDKQSWNEIRAKIEDKIKDGPPGHITPMILQEILLAIADSTVQTRESVGKLFEKFGEGSNPAVAKMRIELMERMDILHDDLNKQRLEIQAAVELLRDSSPAAILVRIQQQEDEIRELKQQLKDEG